MREVEERYPMAKKRFELVLFSGVFREVAGEHCTEVDRWKTARPKLTE